MKENVAAKAALQRIERTQGSHVVRLALRDNADLDLEIRREALLPVAQFLRDDPELDFRYFNMMLGVDRGSHLETIYILNSLTKGLRLQLRVKLDAGQPKVDSVTSIWAGANWHERETYDMFGISFVGHPYPHRMFLEDDFEGHPMLKSFKLAGRAE